MAKKDKKEKKGGLLGRLFGGGKSEEPAADAPPASGGGDERTIAPGYAPDGGESDLTLAPGYVHASPEKSGEIGYVSFGTGRFARPDTGAAPAPAPASAPAPDPFDLDGGAAGRTIAPDYVSDDDMAAGELTMAPGYAGKDLQAPPKPADPFADLDMGERTIAPGYAGPELTAPPKPADPFADLAPASDLTMAPGYAAGPKPGPADPFADLGPSSDLTLAPGYAAGPATDPFAGPASPPAPPARGGPRPDEPFIELDSADLTMPPAYAPPAGSAPGTPPVDPFADLAPAAKGGAPADAFDIDLGGPIAPATAPVIPEDAFSFEPASVAPPRAGGGSTEGEPFDPFGPALLDDPFADATPSPAPATPATPAPALAAADDDFRGERTVIDLTTDVDMLATLEATDELPTPDTPPPVELEGALELGPGLPPVPPAPPLPSPPVRSPMGPTPRARPLFQATRPDAAGTRHVGAAPEVVLDAARGLVFAPAVEGGWADLPAGFRRLSDGAIVGRGRIEGRDVVVAHAPAPQDGELRLPPFPPEVKVDRTTRSVLWPTALEHQLAWRPPRVRRLEAGLSFVLPEGTRFEDDGSVVVPAAATSTEAAPADPTHGRVVGRFGYLGLVEEVHEDGWSRLTLPEGASVEDGRLLIPAAEVRGVPPLLRPERQPDGRLALPLPAGAQASGSTVWVPPSAAAPDGMGEPWADREAGVVETRRYAGVREDLLDDGWLRLELPVGARVERAGDAARVVIPPEYAALGDPAALLELDRLPCGSLSFELPAGAECLGWRVLVPPPGAEPARRDPPRRAEAPAPETATAPAPAVESGEAQKEPEPPSRRMKALDLFRKDKKKPLNDTVTFDGVLRSEVTSTAGAVAPDVPAPAPELARPEVAAAVEAPVAAAVEAAAESADASTGGVGAGAAGGSPSLDDPPTTVDASATDDSPATDSPPTDSPPTDSSPTDSSPTDSSPTDSSPTDSSPTDSSTIDAPAPAPDAGEPEPTASDAASLEPDHAEANDAGDGASDMGPISDVGPIDEPGDATSDDPGPKKTGRRRRKKGK